MTFGLTKDDAQCQCHPSFDLGSIFKDRLLINDWLSHLELQPCLPVSPARPSRPTNVAQVTQFIIIEEAGCRRGREKKVKV